MNVALILLTIAGSIALFLYGMKLLSESLQKILGERIRVILTTMTSNKARSVFAGILITALIQSSSATSVMVVSFVSAGMVRLFEAVCIIMGANIGTTLTAWIISIFGFQFKLSTFALPVIGLGIPLIFSSNRKLKYWGEILLGFSLLFVSLLFLKQYIPAVHNPSIDSVVNIIGKWGYGAYFIFMLLGILFTVIIRSSSAVLALTMVLLYHNWIDFSMAASMVIGTNVGTTIAAITASKMANVTAKRAAYAHLFFNVVGMVWVLAVFPLFSAGIVKLYTVLGGNDPLAGGSDAPMALSLFHTMFNISNTIFLVGFSRQIALFITRHIKSVPGENEDFRLTHIKIGLLSTPDASLYQARRETVVFAERVRKMFLNVERLLNESDLHKYQKLKEHISEDEEFSDRMEKEIASYLTKVAEGRLSESSSRRMRALFKMIDDIESIADSCMNIVNIIDRRTALKGKFTAQIDHNVEVMFNMVRDALDIMVTMLTHDEELPLSLAMETEKEINNFRDILKSEHLNNLERGIYKYDIGIVYNDIISQCERIGDYAINVDESFKNLF